MVTQEDGVKASEVSLANGKLVDERARVEWSELANSDDAGHSQVDNESKNVVGKAMMAMMAMMEKKREAEFGI